MTALFKKSWHLYRARFFEKTAVEHFDIRKYDIRMMLHTRQQTILTFNLMKPLTMACAWYGGVVLLWEPSRVACWEKGAVLEVWKCPQENALKNAQKDFLGHFKHFKQ